MQIETSGVRQSLSGFYKPSNLFTMDLTEFVLLLQEFLGSDTDYLWAIDEQVWPDTEWDTFQNALEKCDADLLATQVRNYTKEPGWQWWASLQAGDESDPYVHGVAALLPLMRVSRAAAKAILRGIDEGWTGHPEALIPTLIHRSGLKIEDIGGAGSFTPSERLGRWYDHRTWHWHGPVEHVPGKLHFPVPRQQRTLARGNIEAYGCESNNNGLKMLYVSPVGTSARTLLPAVLETFLNAGADCCLLQYDGAELPIPEGVRVIRDNGYKWQLALKYLKPDMVAAYDFIFFWDDDLGVDDFDPGRFVRIMRTNRLDMAQPALRSPHGFSHSITKHRSCPPPWRDPDGVTVHPVVGRLTNFVEIMAPVFTRVAWLEFYSYLNPENQSGWGYDYIPLGRKGIVDAMSVVHTRAVQSINGRSEAELRRFLNDQGLFRHPLVEQGWLFE